MFYLARAMSAAVALSFGVGLTSPASAQTAVSVGVNAGTNLATIPAQGFGLNTAVWDGNLLDGAIPNLLKQAGVAALRYPGGSTSDVYNWQTNSIVPGQGSYANPSNTFDAFMGVARSVGATPIITVNYGSNQSGNGGGDPNYAAAWVRYANVTKNYDVRYWEIGNEVYGNGQYGGAWETDLHQQKDPATYGRNVVQFANAMKAVDPRIKIGVVLTAPGRWPDGQSPDWNTNVLAQCASVIDFVVVHWYPQEPYQESDAGLLASPQDPSVGVASMTSRLKSLINQYAGVRAPNIEILVTETNSVTYNPGKQTLSAVNAMFIADNMLTWLENGAASVDVWGLHNGAVWGNASSSLFGATNYGDYGILSNGQSGEPAANTPFPAYYGMQVASYLGKAGDALVASTSNNSLLTTHAARQANGSLAVLLINKDRNNTANANVSLTGFTPGGTATVYSYTPASSAVTSANVAGQGTNFSISVPPYSMKTVVLAGTSAPPAQSFSLSANPTSLTVTQGASGTATVSVTPAGGFTGNVAFSATGLPAGVTATFNPPSSSISTTLTLAAGASAQTGTAAFTITGTSGALSASTALALTINAPAGGGGGGGGAGPATFVAKRNASGPWYYEDDLVLTTTAQITDLTATITVPAANAAYNGAYNTFGGQIVQSFASGANFVYTFRLSPGQSVYPGSGTFAAQMNGNGVMRDLTGDSWSVTYTAGGATYTQSGKF